MAGAAAAVRSWIRPPLKCHPHHNFHCWCYGRVQWIISLFAKQLHLHCDTMKVVLGCSASLQKSQRVSTLSLSSPSRHFRNIPAIHRTGWKIVNFIQILQQKDDFANCFRKMEGWCSMLRESFHCLCSIDTNACFAWQGVVSRVLWLEVMYSWQYSFLLTSPPYQYHMAKK